MKMGKLLKILAVLLLVADVARAGVTLRDVDFATALQKEFVEQGRDENVELEFFGGQTSYMFDDAQKAKILISGLDIDDEQGRFLAKAEIFADGKLVETTSLSGRFFVLGDVFVPAVEISKGELISEDKLELASVRLNRLKEDVVVEKEKLVGMQARKTLKAGKIINDREIGPYIIIKKGALVTSMYKSKGLLITAQAVALSDGAKGQTIELENTKSKKRFWAKVVDAETVEIVVEE